MKKALGIRKLFLFVMLALALLAAMLYAGTPRVDTIFRTISL
jgi:hypothetical protein